MYMQLRDINLYNHQPNDKHHLKRSIQPSITAVLLCAILLISACGQNDTTETPSATFTDESTEVQRVSPIQYDGDVRDMPRARSWQPGEPVVEVPRQIKPPLKPAEKGALEKQAISQIDPLLVYQQSISEMITPLAFSPPGINFDGIAFTGSMPPDTVGDVGPNHYIQMVNHPNPDGGGTPQFGSAFSIYDKAGTLLAGPTILDTIWVAAGGTGACANGRGDPIVLYDQLADRWLMSEFASGTNTLCVYVSQTANPVMGGWNIYAFATPNFPDYPKYAVWPDAYYVTTNEASSTVYAMDRPQMLAGLAAAAPQRQTVTDLAGFGFQSLTPADLDGPSGPPVGAPGYIIRHRDDEAHNVMSDPTQDFLDIWEYHVDFATPANSTFTGPTSIALAEFDSALCGLTTLNCIPQPSTTQTLDPLREVVMWRLQYRNFGTHETLVGNFSVDTDATDHAGIRWFELRKTGGAAWALYQEGTYSPDADHRWMGSIAMDSVGNIALGYSVSSVTQFPSIRYTGRRDGDTPGVMSQAEATIITGANSQTTSNRWGDYSAMSVDPSDGCTFWYTTEYIPAGGNWQTRIAAFKFPSNVSLSANPNELWPPNHKMVPVSLAASDGCDMPPACKIVAVSSNEPINANGDGNTTPDWEITGDLTVKLRAERAGPGVGRIYTLDVECTDLVGDVTNQTITVTVAHDQGA
jgi:hypothetical protein